MHIDNLAKAVQPLVRHLGAQSPSPDSQMKPLARFVRRVNIASRLFCGANLIGAYDTQRLLDEEQGDEQLSAASVRHSIVAISQHLGMPNSGTMPNVIAQIEARFASRQRVSSESDPCR